MKKPTPNPDWEEMNRYIHQQLRAGFQNKTDICQSAITYVDGDQNNETHQKIAEKCVQEAWEHLQEEQKSWPQITDCDRIDQAFAELEKQGIVARQNFSCCQSCGFAEIGDECSEFTKKGTSIEGYTFYHMQDTENAVEGYGIYLSYGSTQDGEAAAINVGRQIVLVLQNKGLSPQWAEDIHKRIFVPMDWKRRHNSSL